MPRESALTSSLREAPLVLLLFGGALAYTVGYCLLFGPAAQPNAPLTFTLGIPTWVCYGVIAPWLVCYALSSVFALCWMADADLEDPAEPNRVEPRPEASDDHAV